MRASKRNHAFSIVELMVVIGIISVLIAMFLPSMARVRNEARLATCTNNLRLIGMATTHFRTDQNTAAVALQPSAWQTILLPYLGNEVKVYLCPEDDTPYAGGLTQSSGYFIKVYTGPGQYWCTLPLYAYEEVGQNGLTRGFRKSNVTANSYDLAMEDGANDTWNDLGLRITTLPSGQVEVKYIYQNTGGWIYTLLDSSGQSIEPLTAMGYPYPNSTPIGLSSNITPPGAGSYGINIQVANSVIPRPGMILAMDYPVAVADPDNDQWTTNWARPSSVGGFIFARHINQVNVVLNDGSVECRYANELDPTQTAPRSKYWFQ